MIYADPIDFLLLSIPELREDLVTRLEDDYDYTWETASICAKLAELAQIVIDDFENGTPPFQKSKRILIVLEEFLQIHGDQNKSNSLEVCFFEDLINTGRITTDSFKTFVSFLGPESIKSCQQNDTFWGVKTPFLYD